MFSKEIDNTLTHAVIGAAMEVHRVIGPGLLESAYHECVCEELRARGLRYESEKTLPLRYKTVNIQCAYRLDLLVEGVLVLELKSIEHVLPVHRAQLLTYLRVGGFPMGLLLNFNVPVLKDGIVRLLNTSPPAKTSP
jgi:GxxExxY protein